MNKFQILIFGASSTHGNWDELGGWAERIRLFIIKRVIEKPKVYHGHVFNLGVPGDTTKDLIKRIDPEINSRLFYPKTIIILSIGTNDSRVFTKDRKPLISDEQFRLNWEELLELAKTNTQTVFTVGLSPVDEKRTDPWDEKYSYINSRIKRFNSIIRECSVKNSVQFIDVYSSFPANECLTLLSDGLHPNTVGHKRIFDSVQSYIDEVLK